ncbi:sulfatase-like hydrolase/transferase [Edaphobacter sp. HDX4]|uniref:sulfatase family protein n=1 Tax=Edaphobacter sp. HDX4 TaxID=2794064 RepID=UPI002FE681DB
MNRRTALQNGMILAASAAVRRSGIAQLAATKRPNVLLIMADQHKRSCMGAYGDKVARTPHLDALAAKSVRFTAAYCANPVCTPSRASLMTGLYSHNHEAQDNAHPYDTKHKTMAHHFGAAGYNTALIGKMHWVDAQSHGFDYRLEFNDWFQYLGPKTAIYADELGRPNSGSGQPEIDDLWREEGDPWKNARHKDEREGSVHVGKVSLLDEKDHFDSFVARESIRYLRRHREEDGPFFLVSSFLKPHDPFMPAQRFADMFKAEEMKLPPSWGKANLATLPKEVVESIRYNGPTPELRDEAQAKQHMAYYYANLAQMDDCVGQLLSALKETGGDRDTIIVYTSDHGEMLGDLGLWQKFQFYEGSCGVPLLIHLPNGGGGVASMPLSQVSLSATLTELCGVRQIQPNDGKSFAPIVRDPGTHMALGPVFAEYALGTAHAKYMARDGDWKYTLWENDREELYDLRSDPAELHNVAADPQRRQNVEHMKAKLLAWHRPSWLSN